MSKKFTAEQLATAQAIADAADEGGTIQADGMVALSMAGHIPNDPTLHTTTLLRDAWRAAGFEADEISEALYG
jgi:hypothetical protein